MNSKAQESKRKRFSMDFVGMIADRLSGQASAMKFISGDMTASEVEKVPLQGVIEAHDEFSDGQVSAIEIRFDDPNFIYAVCMEVGVYRVAKMNSEDLIPAYGQWMKFKGQV